MNKYLERTIKVIVFLSVFWGLAFAVFYVLDYDQDPNEMLYWSYTKEEKNSIDGIFIGNSAINRAWVAPIAWHEEGMTTYSLSCGNEPLALATTIMEQARKTQDLKYVVIDIHQLRTQTFYHCTANSFQRVCDNMPMTSLTRWKGVYKALKYMRKADELGNVTKHDNLDTSYFYFKFMQYHSRWQELDEEDYIKPVSQFKSAYTEDGFYKRVVFDIPEEPDTYDDISDYQKEILDEIMDYANENKIHVFFTCAPSVMKTTYQGQMMAAFDYIEENKTEYIDYKNLATQEMRDAMGIDNEWDFYDVDHLNVRGAAKFTKYLANILNEKYGTTDRSSVKDSWDKAYNSYMQRKEDMFSELYPNGCPE